MCRVGWPPPKIYLYPFPILIVLVIRLEILHLAVRVAVQYGCVWASIINWNLPYIYTLLCQRQKTERVFPLQSSRPWTCWLNGTIWSHFFFGWCSLWSEPTTVVLRRSQSWLLAVFLGVLVIESTYLKKPIPFNLFLRLYKAYPPPVKITWWKM